MEGWNYDKKILHKLDDYYSFLQNDFEAGKRSAQIVTRIF